MREMKDSGIEWIGSIPTHWKTERLQWHITEIKETNKPEKSRQVLSLTNKRGVIPYEEKGAQGNVSKEDYSQYKLAYPGTIVANSMNILIGSVGRCDYFGCVSPVYYVYKPKDGENLEFINYLFQMEQFQKELQVLSKLIIAQLMRIPESIDYVKTVLYPKVSAQVKEDLVSTLPPAFVEKHREQIMNTEFPEQYQKELVLNHSFEPANFDRYCKVLQDGVWVVYANMHRDTMPFLTSDNPVLVEGIGKTETGLFRNGLANPATCIFYPLSPGIAVAIYSRQGIVGVVSDEYDGRKIMLGELKYIMNKNVKIMAQAYHHSFIPQPLYDEIAGGSF